MDERHIEIIRTALLYASSNIDDLNDCFAMFDDDGNSVEGTLHVNGDEIASFDQDDIAAVLNELQ